MPTSFLWGQTCLPRAPANISWPSLVLTDSLGCHVCTSWPGGPHPSPISMSGNSFWSILLESKVKFVLWSKAEVLMSKLEEIVRMAESQPVTLTVTMSFLSPMLTWGPLEHLIIGACKREHLPGSYLGSGPSFALIKTRKITWQTIRFPWALELPWSPSGFSLLGTASDGLVFLLPL